jgi:hypothetical protein
MQLNLPPLSIWAVFYSKMGKMGVKRWGNFESFPNVSIPRMAIFLKYCSLHAQRMNHFPPFTYH